MLFLDVIMRPVDYLYDCLYDQSVPLLAVAGVIVVTMVIFAFVQRSKKKKQKEEKENSHSE